MANVKKLWTAKVVPGCTVYVIVRREIDLYLLNDADGAFAAAPADPYVSLSEDATIKGLYELSESRTAWAAGEYTAFIYIQSGASPAPVDDALQDVSRFYVVGDRICIDFPFQCGAVATDASNTASSFLTNLASATTDYCKDSFIKFVSGNLINQQKRVLSFNGSSKVLAVTSAFTTTPAAGDEFFLVNQ